MQYVTFWRCVHPHSIFRGVHGHFCGALPWWKIEDFVLSESARIVGKVSIQSIEKGMRYFLYNWL